MRKKYIGIGMILFFICLLAIVISFFANEYVKKSINDTFKWISGISSLITLTIALLLFDKYGLNKKIENKRQDIVLELLDELQNVIFVIEYNTNEGGYGMSYFTISREISTYKEYSGKELMVCENYITGISKMIKYNKNYWMPISIQLKLSRVCEYLIITNKEINPFDEKYVRIRFPRDNDNNEDYKKIKYGILKKNGANYKSENYFQEWKDLHCCIMKWIEENADFKLDNN